VAPLRFPAMSDLFNTAPYASINLHESAVSHSTFQTDRDSLMKRFARSASALLALLILATVVIAAEAPTPGKTTIAQLAFLTGKWRGPSSSGVIAEELISAPEGGVMLSAGREFQSGKCIFFDLVVFTENEGAVTLIPHPNGKRSPYTFPLASLDLAAKRVVFENADHDFPKKFLYELVAPDRLRITLTGNVKGQPATEVYDLARMP